MENTIPQDTPQLQCVRCKEWKLLTTENFFRNKNYPTGFGNTCKICLRRVPIPGTAKPIRTTARRDQYGKVLPYPQDGRILDIPSKICSCCHIEKPLDQYGPHKTELYGVRAKCNECRKIESKEYYARRIGWTRESLPDPVNGGKVCRRCKIEKSPDGFSPDKRSSDGIGTQCKQCMLEVQMPHRERNLARTRRKWEENGEKYRAKGKEWRKKNPDRLKELSRRRVARERNTQVEPVSYTHVRERDGMWCYICQQTIYPEQRIAYDHVIPLAPRKGAMHAPGAHAESNIKITHYLCNARKGNKLLEEMTPYQRRGIKPPHIIQPQLFS